MCGPNGVAGSRRVCKPNMSRRHMRRVRSGIQVHRPRVAKKSGSVRSRKKSRGCGPKLSCSASSKETGRVQRSQANWQGKEVARKKDARWTLKVRQTFRRSWISKRNACSGSCGKLRSSRTCLRLSETSRRRHGRRSWMKSREKGQSFCRSIRKFRRSDKNCKACGISTGTSSKRLERVRKKCKRSVRSRRKRKADYETRFPVLLERSGDSWKAAAGLDIEIQSFLASEERRGSSASQSNGCCFDPAILEYFLAFGGALAVQQLAFLQAEVSRVYGGQQYRQEPIARERGARAEEREAWEEEWDDERMANGWYEIAAYGSAVDPAEGSDDVGGSFGRRESQHSKKWDARS